MKRNCNPSDSSMESFRNNFIGSIRFIRENWGDVAFHNTSPTDPNRLVRKFSPTIFDSISIATAVALDQGMPISPGDCEQNRRKLLQDATYRNSISKETMTKDSITTRISLALEYLYGG